MPSIPDERARCHTRLFDLRELRTLYAPSQLRDLIVRALAQLDDLQRKLDAHLMASANKDAVDALHLMAGTASFFCGSEEALGALHSAQNALKSSDAVLIRAALRRARDVLAALTEALTAELRLASAT